MLLMARDSHHWIAILGSILLTHWGRVTHICVGILTSIGSDNGLSPGRRQAIIWTNAGILLIEPLGTNFSEILIRIQAFSFKKMHLKMSSAKWRPFCLGLNVLTPWDLNKNDISQTPFLNAFSSMKSLQFDFISLRFFSSSFVFANKLGLNEIAENLPSTFRMHFFNITLIKTPYFRWFDYNNSFVQMMAQNRTYAERSFNALIYRGRIAHTHIS